MLNRENSKLYDDLERVLLGREEIAARVAELGAEITRDYAGKTPLCVGILKGATPFYCDLIRCIDLKHTHFAIRRSRQTLRCPKIHETLVIIGIMLNRQ